jgi:hypothetical protein
LHIQPVRVRRPNVDRSEQEQPDHVDEVPIPGGSFEAGVLAGRGDSAYKRNRQTARKIVPMKT